MAQRWSNAGRAHPRCTSSSHVPHSQVAPPLPHTTHCASCAHCFVSSPLALHSQPGALSPGTASHVWRSLHTSQRSRMISWPSHFPSPFEPFPPGATPTLPHRLPPPSTHIGPGRRSWEGWEGYHADWSTKWAVAQTLTAITASSTSWVSASSFACRQSGEAQQQPSSLFAVENGRWYVLASSTPLVCAGFFRSTPAH